jgi:acetyl esterase/lipase
MKYVSRFIITAILIFFSAGCLKTSLNHMALRAEKKIYKGYGDMEKYGARCDNEILNIIYAPDEKDADELTLNIYYNDHEGLYPMIINIHGGGWLMGDKEALNTVYRSKYLADRGYVVFNVNYRMLWDYPIQTQIEDVMGAVIWAKEHAAEYGADPSKVGVIGGSAGGHLTAMVAWASDDPYFKPTGHTNSKYDSDVLAAVPFYAPLDLEKTLNLDKERPISGVYKVFTDTKKGPAQDEVFKHISPKYHVSPDLPPTFFVCGDQDGFKVYPQAVEYENKLRENGVDTGLYTAIGESHAFDLKYGTDQTKQAMEKTVDWFDRYLK